jgi:hypothetical protein
MVVTDLHGDWPLYQHLRDVFLKLSAQGLVHTLVFTGDLIHNERAAGLQRGARLQRAAGLQRGAAHDQSLAIVLDLIELQEALGPQLIVLLGNHEMPHIYHVPLAKGDLLYTPRFEREMGGHRDAILAFFRRCPFFVRTAAGVTLCHAGGFPEAGDRAAMATLLTLRHQELLERAARMLAATHRPALRAVVADMEGAAPSEGACSEAAYGELVGRLLAVTGPEDPRYDDHLLGALVGRQAAFKLLWSMLFSQNEHAAGMAAYTDQVAALLGALSEGYPAQRALVTGHFGCRGGYRVLAQGRHLRVASGAHAHPYASARYLIFDAAAPVGDATDLLPGLVPVFGEG